MLLNQKREFKVLLATAAGMFLAGMGLAAFVAGETKEIIPKGFVLEKDVQVVLEPNAAFDAFTGDVSPWWDHHFSPKPSRLVIEPRPGGHFLEIFDEEGNGVTHGLVTWSERGKKLVIRGWLGPFHSNASVLVHTFTFEKADSGTRIKVVIRAEGEVDAQTAVAVDRVWEHFLVEQFKRYAEELSKK